MTIPVIQPTLIKEKLMVFHLEDDLDWQRKINLVLEKEFSLWEIEFIQTTNLSDLETIVNNAALPSILIVDLNLHEKFPDHEGFAYLARHSQKLLDRQFEIFVFSGYIDFYDETSLLALGIPPKHIIDKNLWDIEEFIRLISDALVQIKNKIAEPFGNPIENIFPILSLRAKLVGDSERLREDTVFVTNNNKEPYFLTVSLQKNKSSGYPFEAIDSKDLFLHVSGVDIESKPTVSQIKPIDSDSTLPKNLEFELYFKSQTPKRASFLTVALHYKNELVKKIDFKVNFEK